jgi:hypothetical protein
MPCNDHPGHIHTLALHPLRCPCRLDSDGSLDLILPGFVISIRSCLSQLEPPVSIGIFPIVFSPRGLPVVTFSNGRRREDVM